MSILKVYNPFPIEINNAHGIYIYSKDEKKYIDTFSGIGVLCFGHSYGPLIEKMKLKMDRYMHLSNFFVDEDMEVTAKKIIQYTGAEGKVFFTNSGTEAVEGALKAIKKIGKNKKKKIIYFSESFHGRTLGALSINGFPKLRDPFLPLLPDTEKLPFNDMEAFHNYMNDFGEEVIAVFLEPIQGSGGIVSLKQDFVNIIMKYKEKLGYILVIDEIQAGLGRTGKIYSYQNFALKPDIITIGKALGGGLPLGAIAFLGETSEIFKANEHGSTFAPNPVALAGGRFVLETLPSIINEVTEKGNYFRKSLESLKSDEIIEIRGLGLMIGIALNKEAAELKDKAFREENLILNLAGHNKIIRLLPPLNIELKEIDLIVEKIKSVMDK